MQEKYPVLNQFHEQSRKEGVQGLSYNNIISPHFCWTVIGTPGSGKTTFIQQLLKDDNFYKDKFDYILIVSPSPIIMYGMNEECVSKEFKIDWLYERINFLKTQNLKNKNILIILDDCVSSLKQYQNDAMLIDLFYNRRHIIPQCTISLIITTQQFTMLPLRFRGVSDHFTFLSMSPRDFEFVKKELVYSFSRKCMSQVMETFQQKHQFIYIRIQPFLLCQNFRPLIEGSSYVAVSKGFDSLTEDRQVYMQEEQQHTKAPVVQSQGSYNNYQQLQTRTNMFSFKNKI